MRSKQIEEAQGAIGPFAVRALAVGAQSIGRDCNRRRCAQRGRTRIHGDWATGNWARQDQATGNRRATGNTFTRDRFDDHTVAIAVAMQGSRDSKAEP